MTEESTARASTDLSPANCRVRMTVNGESRHLDVEPRRTLVDVLRHDLGLGSVRAGCEQGICGSCTVRVGGEPVRSCLMFAAQLDGADIQTIEGLGAELTDLQEALREHHGLQCGYCTPGFLMLIEGYLELCDSIPSDEQVVELLSSNICRCTGYQGLIAAVREVVATRQGAQHPGAHRDETPR